MTALTLSYQTDPADSISLLHARVETPRFSGQGGSWAAKDEIEAFARGLKAYPLPAEPPLSLRFGFNRGLGEDLLFGLTIRPADALGNLLVTVEIADYA